MILFFLSLIPKRLYFLKRIIPKYQYQAWRSLKLRMDYFYKLKAHQWRTVSHYAKPFVSYSYILYFHVKLKFLEIAHWWTTILRYDFSPSKCTTVKVRKSINIITCNKQYFVYQIPILYCFLTFSFKFLKINYLKLKEKSLILIQWV